MLVCVGGEGFLLFFWRCLSFALPFLRYCWGESGESVPVPLPLPLSLELFSIELSSLVLGVEGALRFS